MANWKETRFDLTGIKHIGEQLEEKFVSVYLTENEDTTKTLSVELDGYAIEIPFDKILDYSLQAKGSAYH